MSTERPVRILSVDDSADIAELSQRMISRESDMEGVGVLTSADGLFQEVVRQEADVVILDLSMPGADPLEAMREVTERTSCRVVVLSGDDHPDTVDRAMSAGAAGFISKHAAPREVVEAVRRVARGECPLPGGW